MAVVDPNPLGANAPSTSANPALPAPPQPTLTQHLGQIQAAHMEQWHKLQESEARLNTVRGVMDKLTSLGDMVTPEDVVKGAGNLVAAGMSAPAIAGLLADMPEQPDAMQAWLKQQDTTVRQHEVQLKQAKAVVGHQLGVSSLKLLMGIGAEQMEQRRAAGAASTAGSAGSASSAGSPPFNPLTSIMSKGSSNAD